MSVKLGPNQVRIILREVPGGKHGTHDLTYARDFVGISIADAIKRLESGDSSQGSLPQDYVICEPVYLNRVEIVDAWENTTILNAGDVLSFLDP